MFRKWTTLAALLVATGLTVTGLTWAADDDESPMEKLMSKVGSKNSAINKAVRNGVAYKKAKDDLPALCDDLIKLGKEARESKESADKQKKPFEDWQKLMDDYIKETEKFKETVAKASTSQEQAKTAFKAVSTTCNACHEVFKKDD